LCRWFSKFGGSHIFPAGPEGSIYEPGPKIKRLSVWHYKGLRNPWDIVVCDRTTQTALQSLTPPFMSFSRVKDLLDTCKEHHTGCSLPTQDHVILNLRVIDCTSLKVVDAPANCQYVALSYVWGSAQSVDDDLSSMQNLPRVIRQRVEVTSKLGFEFLWIDRYVS
jgi:hypothetical protein